MKRMNKGDWATLVIGIIIMALIGESLGKVIYDDCFGPDSSEERCMPPDQPYDPTPMPLLVLIIPLIIVASVLMGIVAYCLARIPEEEKRQ